MSIQTMPEGDTDKAKSQHGMRTGTCILCAEIWNLESYLAAWEG